MILSLLSRRLACVGILAMGLTLFSVKAAPATLIDSFDTAFNAPQTSIFAMMGTQGVAVVNDGGIIGGQREMVLGVNGGIALLMSGGSGTIMQVQGGASAQTNLQLTYDGDDETNPLGMFNPTGLGGMVLSGTSFLLRAMSNQPIVATIRVFTDATNFSEGVLTTSSTGPGMFETFSIAFTDFDTGAGASGAADFNNVGAIQIDLNVTGDLAMLTYDLIETDGILAVAPEPGSWALLCLGALGTIGYSQFRRRRARTA